MSLPAGNFNFSWKQLLLTVAIFLAGGSIGFLVKKTSTSNAQVPVTRSVALRQGNNTYEFINPLLGCDNGLRRQSPELQNFNTQITKLVQTAKSQGQITDGSVYFRALAEGQWFGVNEDAVYFPASLLKVSLMIAYYKIAETNPSILNERIRYEVSDDLNTLEKIKPSTQLEVGKYYTVEQLIEQMIEHSDNNALQLLMKSVDAEAFSKTFSDLNLSLPQNNEVTDFMSPKSYSIFFRILYNATYLSRDMSERALTILSKADFTDGLTNDLPPTITVAHKFGEYNNLDQKTNTVTYHELHDCGIVYYPKHPYLLCVMTRGNNFDALKTTIQAISSKIFTLYAQKYPQ